jgi:hypothetical protein
VEFFPSSSHKSNVRAPPRVRRLPQTQKPRRPPFVPLPKRTCLYEPAATPFACFKGRGGDPPPKRCVYRAATHTHTHCAGVFPKARAPPQKRLSYGSRFFRLST